MTVGAGADEARAPLSAASRSGAADATFKFSYMSLTYPLLWVMGFGPSMCDVSLRASTLRVRMGFWFSADVPLVSIHAVHRDKELCTGIGVHGSPWRGEWLVNGHYEGLVRVSIAPAARARVCGVAVELSTLRLSLEEPDRFVAALAAAAPVRER